MHKVQTSLRLDEEKFKQAKEILSELGLNFTEAVNIFTSMVIANKGLPFEVKLPNDETIQTMKDIRQQKNLKTVSTDELMEEMDLHEKA